MSGWGFDRKKERGRSDEFCLRRVLELRRSRFQVTSGAIAMALFLLFTCTLRLSEQLRYYL